MSLTRNLANALLTGAIAVATLAVSTTPASAFVVCNRFGDCWHASDRYDYPATAGIVVHDDGWVFDRPGFYRWAKDHPGRGYWEHGHWRHF